MIGQQEIIVIALFLAAASYIGWRVRKAFDKKSAGCAKGCGCETDKALTQQKRAHH